MLKWERKKKKDDKKETPPAREDLEDIGLSPSKSSSDISIHNESGTYISHASIAEIKKGYGTIHEYLKQRFGPGKYTVTVRGKGSDDTQRISIAGEDTPSWPENPMPGGMDNNQLMGIYLTQQTEIARLRAELETAKNSSQQSVLGQIIPTAMDFIKTMMTSRPDTDLASVMTAATDCLKTLSEIKTPGEKSDDVGGLMGGIAQLLQGVQQRQQPAPNPASMPVAAPLLMPQATSPFQVPPAPPVSSPMPINVVSTPEAGLRQPLSPLSVSERVNSQTVQQTPPSPMTDNNGTYTDVFFENLLGMIEQKQAPKIVAAYIVQSIQKISPQEILDPQIQVLVMQLQANPVNAFDAICQFEPALATDGKYITEIRTELQRMVSRGAK